MTTGHERYFYSVANHEAAYDSFLTAKILIRMSAFLEADGDYVDVPDNMHHILAKNPDALGKSLRVRKSEAREARARPEVADKITYLLQQPSKGQGKTTWLFIPSYYVLQLYSGADFSFLLRFKASQEKEQSEGETGSENSFCW